MSKLVDRCLLQEWNPVSRHYNVPDMVLAVAKRKLVDDNDNENNSNDMTVVVDDNSDRDRDSDRDRHAVVRAVASRQARYLGDLDVLLRYASHSAGDSGGVVGNLESLAALWQSLEELCSRCVAAAAAVAGRGRDDGSTVVSSSSSWSPSLLLNRATYGDALEEAGECARAAAGYWAAATLLQLQVYIIERRVCGS